MRYFILLFLAIFAVTGCDDKKSGHSSSTSNPQATPGQLKLVAAPSTALRSVSARAVIPRVTGVDFAVGDIRSTTTYLFLLKNSGGSSVSNIVLTSTNSAVEVVPSTIGILEPDSVGGLSPIIQVTVKHGSGAGHFGTAPLLAPGDIQFSIGASGTNSQGATNVSASIGGTVRVADFNLTRNGTDFSTISEGNIGNRSTVDGQLPYVAVGGWSNYELTSTEPTDSLWQVTNTGNCPLTVKSYRNWQDSEFDIGGAPTTAIQLATATVITTQTVAPGETVSINAQMRTQGESGSRSQPDGTFIESGLVWRFEAYIQISSAGVVLDPSVQLASQDDSAGIYLQELVFVAGGGAG